MTPAQYQRLALLFQAAMEVPLDQRAALAQKLCAGDAELLSQLLALLGAADEPLDSLDRPLGQLDVGRFRPNSSPGALSPVVLERFRIVCQLGRGGMGKVFQAVDRETGATVAVKLIQTRGAFAEQQRMRFLREARSVGALRHPNIVEVYDIGQAQGHLFLVMEYLEGRSMRILIGDSAQHPFPSTLLVISQIAKALAFAHSKGVIHGDVKPDNIMVLNDGSAKLVDFGVAEQIGLPNSPVQGGGTPAYFAPERLLAPAPTAASDIWSLGVTLFECFTGKRPFANSVEVQSSPSPVLPSDLPLAGELNALIALTLVKDPAERLQSAEELATELERLCARVDSSPKTESPANSNGATQKESSHETYELTDLGFRSEPVGELETKMASFPWAKRRRLLLAWRDRWIASLSSWNRTSSVKNRSLLWKTRRSWPLLLINLATGGIFRIAAVVAIMAFVGLTLYVFIPVLVYVPVALCLVLGALSRLPFCRNCHMAMRRTSSHTRLARDRAEVVYGQSDCMAALKHGLWQEAAKLLSIHGRESISAYANNLFAPARFRLDFFECDTCCDHAARLTAEDRDEDSWKLREQYYDAYWRGPKQRLPRLVYFSNFFKRLGRIVAEAGRILKLKVTALVPAVGGVLLAAIVFVAFGASARQERTRIQYYVKQHKICYGYDGLAKSVSRQAKPFRHIELNSEKEIQDFVRNFKCSTEYVADEGCEMYCNAK